VQLNADVAGDTTQMTKLGDQMADLLVFHRAQ
jgi:hypothetical protein